MKNYLVQFKKQRKKVANLVLFFALLLNLFSPEITRANYPVISGVTSTSITTVSATITWTTTDINSNSFVDYGLTTNYDNSRGNGSLYAEGHSVTIDGLSPNTPYKFRVRSADAEGHETTDNNGEAGFDFTTSAAPTISNVRLAEVTNTYATITWNTDIEAYPFIAYGSTESYGQLIGDEENHGTSHSLTIAGLSAGSVKHYRPRVKDLYGNFTLYGIDSTFTAGAPYLASFTSTTLDGYYGPGDPINITANYTDSAGNNLDVTSSTVTVLLDTGVQVVLGTVGTNTLSGTYTVGGAGLGENSVDLRVSSLVSQNVCDINNYCHTGLTMIAPENNIFWVKDIYVDTIIPIFSSVLPVSSSSINSVTASSDISYTLSEGLGSGTIVMERTSGSLDPSSPHTCTLTASALRADTGPHNNFDTTTGCSGGAITLVDGAVYDFDFDGQDPSGNNAGQIARTGVTFDTSEPQLASFTSTTANGTYGPASNINITATYGVGENLANGSSITVTLNTGVPVVLSTIESGNKLTGTYVVGATGSGQNTSDLTVSAPIVSQNAVDQAGNVQSGTGLPATNIAGGSAIIIDTTAPDVPSLVNFITDPIDNSNKNAATLRVDGEVGATILYSIDDDNNTFTNPTTGSAIMEGDGSTDITGLDLSGLADGTLTATVTLRDPALNVSVIAEDTVTKDTTGPTFAIQYYSDAGLINSLGDNPELKAGTYYLKITSLEALSGTPTISIAAEGANNDVSSAATSLVSGNDYIYTRTISEDAAAVGSVLENISLTGTDTLNNTSTNIDPMDESSKAAFTDTKKPVVNSGSATPDFAKAGTVNVSLVFDDPMNETTAPTVVITKFDNNDLVVSGSYTSPTAWSGTATVSSGDANGTATLKASGAKDLAGNTMDANNNVDTFVIDTADPTFTVNEGVSGTPVTTDTINVSVSDTGGSGLASQFYGFSSDNICTSGDIIDNAFSSGVNFDITGDHSEYLCVKATDHADNVTYQSLGQLHVDNTAPTVSSVSSNHADGHFKAGVTIDIDVTFSENVTSTGDMTVNLDSGGSCIITAISNSNTGTCDYIVGSGQNSPDLDVLSVAGTIADQAGNPLTNHVPIANLAGSKAIVVDTTAPILNIISPLSGTRVKDDATISFSDDENADPQCSIDNTNWISCASGSTAFSSLTGWGSLGEGNFTLYVKDTDAAGNIGMDTEVDVIKDNIAPTISNVSSNHADGHFKAGEVIDIDLVFSEAVTSTGDVIVTLETGTTDRLCTTFTVSNSTTGTCNYTVQAGDTSNDLDVLSVEGTIKDQALNQMTNLVPGNNLAYYKAIVIDTTAPAITSVSSNHADGTFSDPELIDIDVTFSESVTSTLVTVTLDSGGSCTFPISNSSFGTCDYIVQSGENSIDLNAFSISGTINDQAQNTLTNYTPATNLAADHAIVIDTTPAGKPTIASVTSEHPDGSFNAGETIDVVLTFSEPVTSSGGFVAVTFDSGGSCTFSVTNATTAICSYTIQAGENSLDLSVQSVSGTIKDQAQNQMTNMVPATNLATNNIVIDTTAPDPPVITLLDPITDANKTAVTIIGTGEANASISYSIDDTNPATNPVTGIGNVGGDGSINISGIDLGSLDGGTITAAVTLTDAAANISTPGQDTATSQVAKPTISDVTSSHANGTFKAKEVIDIDVTFSEAVTSTGNVTVTLDSGGTCSFTVSNASSGTCDYTVLAGQNSADLNVSNISGTIKDQAQNALTNFTPATNLAANKAIVIDTTGVVLNSFTSTASDNIYGPGSAINITASYSENLAVDSTVTVVLDTGAEISLSTITDSKKLTGTYTVGATGGGENSIDLAVVSISSQNVCDTNGKCDTDALMPDTNISTGSNIIVDTTVPEFSDILPAASTNIHNVTSNSDISFTLSEDLGSGTIVITRTAWTADPASPHTCALAGNSLQKGKHNKFDTSLCQGGAIQLVSGAVYTFAFEGEDLAGNISADQTKTGVSYGIDDSAPVLSNVEITNITSTSATITWTTNEASSSLIDFGADLNYGSTSGKSDDSVTSHSVAITNLNPATNYKLRVRSTDPERNETIDDNSAQGYSFSTLALAVNSDVTVTKITSSGATISWTSDTKTYSYVYFGTTESFGRVVGNEESLTQEHSITLAGLDPNTTYYFRARTKDVGGNFSLGSAGNFKTLNEDTVEADTTMPKISGVSSKKGLNSSYVISWKTNKDCNGMVRFGLNKNYGQSAAEDATIDSVDNFATSHEVTLNNLLSNTTYHFSAVSYDAAGNIALSGDDTFTTPPLSSISSVKVTDVTLNSATIVWETGDPTTSVVEYGLTISYGQTKTDTTSVNLHKIQLTGLETGKTYHFRVKGVNKDKNSVFSDDYVFATNDMPALKGYTLGEVTDSTIALGWGTNVETDTHLQFQNKNNPDDKGDHGVEELVQDHKVVLNGLEQGNDYELKIKGTDVNKNSFESDLFTVTTQMDRQAPAISQINTQSSLINGKDNQVQSIITWKTDESATSQAVFDIKRTADGEQPAQQSKVDPNLTTNHVVVLTSLKPGSVYYFRVISADKNENSSESDEFSLLAPQKQKSVIQLIIANFEQTFGWLNKMKINK